MVIKKFNEFNKTETDIKYDYANEIKEYVKSLLADLLDKGYYLDAGFVSNRGKSYTTSVCILKNPNENTTGFARIEEFLYSDVKDNIIPFVKMCNHLYNIDRNVKFTTKVDNQSPSIFFKDIDDLDNIGTNKISSIRLTFFI